jgi:hypothetical protein
VYYNPANPAEACLETGQHWTAWVGKAIALLIVLVPAGCCGGVLIRAERNAMCLPACLVLIRRRIALPLEIPVSQIKQFIPRPIQP